MLILGIDQKLQGVYVLNVASSSRITQSVADITIITLAGNNIVLILIIITH